jgi:predicted phage terminase large subunit-like protein
VIADIEKLTTDDVRRIAAYASPADLGLYTSRGHFTIPRHIDYLNKMLLRVLDGDLKRLMVFMPRRYGKSTMVSKFLPCCFLGQHPDKRVILTSYSADYAEEWGRKCRNLMDEFSDPIWGVRIAQDSSAAGHWNLHKRLGGMDAVGAGGSLNGRGADCLMGETLVETDSGKRTIEDIYTSKNSTRVLSLDLYTGHAEFRRVLACIRKAPRQLVEVRTHGNRSLRCTPEHLVYVQGRGYRQAALLRPGDRLSTCQDTQEQGLRGLREDDVSIDSLQAMLLGEAQSIPLHEMLFLREGVPSDSVRRGETAAQRAQGFLLFAGLLSESPRGEARSQVRALPETNAKESRDKVLLQGMQSSESTCEGFDTLWELSQSVYSEASESAVLLKEMCRLGTFGEDAWEKQLALQGRRQLHHSFLPDTESNTGTRQRLLRGVQQQTQAARPPRRRKLEGQQAREPRNSVQCLPSQTPQVEEDTVSVVRRVRGDAVCVYDLQVEGNHNFFADQVLVHNCMILDDLIANDQDAYSKTIRDKVWDWWQATARPCIEPNGAAVLIMTRWHEDDIAGRILREHDHGWTVLELPAEARENDPIGRAPGDPLWPERWPTELLAENKKCAWVWAAEYQQRPTLDEGAVFKRQFLRYFTNSQGTYKLAADDGTKVFNVDECRRLITMDLAVSTKTMADYTVVSAWAVTPESHLLCLDVRRVRLEGPDQVPMLRAMYEQFKPCTVHIEQVAYQLALVQEAMRAGLPVRPCHVDKDKVSRAMQAARRMATGYVYLKEGASWMPEFEAELLSFPLAEHDDMVDTLSMAVQDVASHAVPRIRSLS